MLESLDYRLTDVKVALPNGRALFSIMDLVIPAGQHLLVYGESGGGKTTFLHLLAGLFPPVQGKVALGTRDLLRLSDDERCDLRRREIGVIFQKLNLLDHLTVRENVALVGGEVEEPIQKVRLEDRADEICSRLSLGEQQRVAVARVLAQKPAIILADEPTSSLDATNTDFVMSSLKEAAAGRTLIVVSHDPRIEGYFDKTLAFGSFRQ